MIANARMYAVNADVGALWARLFEWIARRSEVPLDVVTHRPVLPIVDLWSREDLGCVFMCGFPWSVADPNRRPQLLAAPHPSPARYGGRPAYCTDIVVRDDSFVHDLPALRGTRFAYAIEHSQSGWQAPRSLFAGLALAAGGWFFGEVVGPLETPRAIVDAVLAGRVDAGPLDSYWHDLLRLHEPATAARLRTVASSPMTAMPALVCGVTTSDPERTRLVAALEAFGDEPALGTLRDALCLHRFSAPNPAEYALLARSAARTDALGYPRLQ